MARRSRFYADVEASAQSSADAEAQQQAQQNGDGDEEGDGEERAGIRGPTSALTSFLRVSDALTGPRP